MDKYLIGSRQITSKLKHIGYEGDMNYSAVARWLMDEKDWYVMPIPKPWHKWMVTIVILDRPNTQDNLLNRFEIEEVVNSYDSCIRRGVEFSVNSLYEAQKEIEKHIGDKTYFDSITKHLRDEGFDV